MERHLLHGKLVVIFGFGGIGKTALAREAAEWLTHTGMYAGACFVSFEHGGQASTLLSALGHFLDVYDSSYNPQETTAALAHLKPALKARRTLLIADNLESLLPAGEAPLDLATRTQLWDVLLDLAQLGAGVLLTSRDTAFGDGRLAPGKLVAHVALGGLYPDDAYALATHLLADLGIDRKRAPYAQLRELLGSLDYHPLAIQLLLPTLRQASLAKITRDFAALLPQFQDDTVTGRNSSLLASLQRLSPAQRALLPRLALFEGGAMEAEVLTITQIPKGEWAQLRPALEQAALLSAEQIHEGVMVPFLRFHPVLTPSLRSQSGVDDAGLRERYQQRYYGLANYLYDEDTRHPQPVRALAQRELPNLRRALTLLLEAGEVETASKMAVCIDRFLTIFGLRREREDLRRRVEKAVGRQSETQVGGALTQAEWLRESGRGRMSGNRATCVPPILVSPACWHGSKPNQLGHRWVVAPMSSATRSVCLLAASEVVASPLLPRHDCMRRSRSLRYCSKSSLRTRSLPTSVVRFWTILAMCSAIRASIQRRGKRMRKH